MMRKWRKFHVIGETNHHLFMTQELKNYQSDDKKMLIGVECIQKNNQFVLLKNYLFNKKLERNSGLYLTNPRIVHIL